MNASQPWPNTPIFLHPEQRPGQGNAIRKRRQYPHGPTGQHPSAQSSTRDEATPYAGDADTTVAQRANIPQPRANALGLPRRPIGGL